MGTAVINRWPELKGYQWARIVERTVVPWAVGALGGQLWMAPRGVLGSLLPAVGLFASLVLALLLLRRLSSAAEGLPHLAWLRGECAMLALATLSAAAHLALSLSGRQGEEYLLRAVALVIGLVAMVVITLGDWRVHKGERELYALLAQPWFATIKLGLLGSWLIASLQTKARFTVADQRLLSLVMLAVVFGLVTRQHRRNPAGIRSGEAHLALQGAGDRLALFTSLNIWGGHIAPGVLLGLTITTGWIYPALLAWFLLLLGDGLRHYLLSQH